MNADRIQEGIYFRSGETPPPAYRLLLLDVSSETPDARDLRRAIGVLYERLRRLPAGVQADLEGVRTDTAAGFEGLKVLLAYGRPLFDGTRHGLAIAERPEALAYLGSGPQAPFPSLTWDRPGDVNRGEADFALQFTASHQSSVDRAAVEALKVIVDEDLPLSPRSSFSGFGRPDGRGWLEFHDGVSNMRSEDRTVAITASGEPSWMAGGTYMAFLRCTVDLPRWRRLDVATQEALVGRAKLTGLPINSVAAEEDGSLTTVSAEVSEPMSGCDRSLRADPPQGFDPILEASHVHRANQNRASPYAPGAFRIFRQGYEYLDTIDENGARLGLNFVSFQSDLVALSHILNLAGWLGDANFGGFFSEGCPASIDLCGIEAGGFYAVPPVETPFPGASLFV